MDLSRLGKPRDVGNFLMEAEENTDRERNENSSVALDPEFLLGSGSTLPVEISLAQILKGLGSSNKELRFILELIKSH